MRRLFLALVLTLTAALLPAADYAIDAGSSNVQFSVPVLAVSKITGKFMRYDVKILAGKAPDVDAYTRPNDVPGWVWVTGIVTRVDWEKPRVAEDWTLKLTEYKGPKDFKYAVAGSKTGADGEGSSAGRFVSTSGRVIFFAKSV